MTKVLRHDSNRIVVRETKVALAGSVRSNSTRMPITFTSAARCSASLRRKLSRTPPLLIKARPAQRVAPTR
jgi:hypothetical protein